MIEVEDGDFTCHAFFPYAVSAAHPETMLRLILESFVKPAADEMLKDSGGEPEYFARRAMQELAGDSTAKHDERKRQLLVDWARQDLCFATRKDRFLLPHSAAVGGLRWKSGKGQEAYDRVVDALARGGRAEAHMDVELGRKRFFELFAVGGEDVGADLVEQALPKVEVEPHTFDAPARFTDVTFCKPHARLFQDDIYFLSKWDIPRGQRIELLKRVLVYHLCAYFIRMAKLADWTAVALLNKLDSPQAYASEQVACGSCREAYRSDPASATELASNCRFHPGFAVGGRRSQEWHEVLARYHVNVAVVNLILRTAGMHDRRRTLPDDVLTVLGIASRGGDLAERVRNACADGPVCGHAAPSGCIEASLNRRFSAKGPPKGHAWDFFRRNATSAEVGFMFRIHRDGTYATLSPQLLNAWGHIYCTPQRPGPRGAYFVQFQSFLRARGVLFQGDGLVTTEAQLGSLGLLRQYADMGVARRLEPVFPLRAEQRLLHENV